MRKLFIATLLTSITCITAHAETSNAPKNDESTAVKNIVDTIMQKRMADNNLPGAAVDVYYNGHEYQYLYGYANESKQTPVTRDTLFDLASVTKIFTTTLLATEVKVGKVKLTDPIVKYLPDLSATKGLPIDNVTLLNLATHTASFPRTVEEFDVDKDDEAGLMQSLKAWHPSYAIGSQYLYSNVSFGLLGLVLANAAGQSYMDVLNQQVLAPLGMTNTMVYVPKTKSALQATGYNLKDNQTTFVSSTYLFGGGSLRSSPADMMKFLKANLNVPVANVSTTLLSSMQLAQQPQYTVRPNFILGLGWQRITRNGNMYITKNGANVGFTSFIGFMPKDKFGVVVLINKKQSQAGKIGNQILNQLTQLDSK